MLSGKSTKLLIGLLLSSLQPCEMQAQKKLINTLQFRTEADTKDYFRYTGKDVPIISGHRGGATKDFPENCIPTLEQTLSITPAIFEIDPHLTKDSAIVLLHDATLDRVTNGQGKLNDHTLAEVENLKLKDLDGNVTAYHLNTLEEAIIWSKGKTIINLDVKDVPLAMKVELVKKHNAFHYVMFTIHNAAEARLLFEYDARSLFSAWILTQEAFDAYEATGVPWSNFSIAYLGPKFTPENKILRDKLHKKDVMVMIGAGPSYDKLDSPEKRAEAYRQLIKDGADVIETDRPVEVAAAIKLLYPKKNKKYKYWRKDTVAK